MDQFSSSLERGLSILRWLSPQSRPCGVREISAATGINKSSVHRFLGVMLLGGWVAQDAGTGKYRIGLTPVEIGLAALGNMQFRVASRRLLDSMADRTGETCYLGILVGTDVVYIDVILGRHAIVMNRPVGERLPAHRTAIGKILLAALPDDQLAHLLSKLPLQESEDGSVLDMELLQSELEESRRVGLAHNDEESASGVYGVGAPVRDFSGLVVAGIGLGGPKERVFPRLPQYSELVSQVAAEASQHLGYSANSQRSLSIDRPHLRSHAES